MALLVDTSTLTPVNIKRFSYNHQRWVYCGLDGCVTKECEEVIEPLMTPNARWSYKFDMAVRVVALSMSRAGIRIDTVERHHILHDNKPGAPLVEQGLIAQREVLWRRLQMLADAVWDKGLNPNSGADLQDFFYRHMRLEVQYEKRQNGEKTPSCNRTALEKLAKNYFYARPIIKHIFAIKDLDGQIRVLQSGVDPDGRMRASFNAKVTETGRWSSSKNPYGTGTNFQNINQRLRRVFIADEDGILLCPDLSQAESRVVAYESGDEAYIKACESGDLHTTTAMMAWPELNWDKGTSPEHLAYNKKLAEQPFYRWFSRRDLSKKAGHASNYMGKPYTISRNVGVEVKVIEEFQERYYGAFAGIPEWHKAIIHELQTTGMLVTALGRVRLFFSRLNDKETFKEGIAYKPQSTVVDTLDIGLLRIWHYMVKQGKPVRLLQQGHDSLLINIPYRGMSAEEVYSLMDEVQQHLRVPVPIKGRTMVIPTEMKCGPSWGKLFTLSKKQQLLEAMEEHHRRMDQLANAPMQTFLSLPAG